MNRATDRFSPLAQRAWAPPTDWKPQRRAHRRGSWPQAAFLLTTLTAPVAGEAFRYGACALLPSLLPGQRPVDLRLFCPDDCPAEDLARLARLAAKHGLPAPLRRAELVRLLYRRCYKQRLPLVGFRLEPKLGQIAVGWRPGNEGGVSLILASRPCPAGRRTVAERRRRPLLTDGQIEDGDYARLGITPLDGQRSSIRFRARGRPDEQDRAPDGEGGKPDDHYVYPGLFVDLATVASVQTSAHHPSAWAAAQALGLPTPDDVTCPADPESLLAELDLLAALYLRLLDCHQQTPGGERLTIDQVYSAASYADALLDMVGLDLPLAHSDLPTQAHALGMGAFFGGDCGISLRHQDVPVAYLDLAGQYPVAAHLSGAFELLRATKLDLVEEDPAELEQLLANLDSERLLADPAIWRRLGRTVCLIRPTGQTLPHRIPKGNTLMLKTAPLECDEPLPYLLADLSYLALRGEPVPQIISATSLQTIPRRRKRLRPVRLLGGRRFDPRQDDLFLLLAEERQRIETDHRLSAVERERRGKLLKLINNAACFGLLCQINVQPRPGSVELASLDGTIRTRPVDAVEEPGRRAMPLIAAGVTATGRLLLHLTRSLYEQAGATVCSWDTDSACIASTPTGSPHQDGILTLSHEAVGQVQQQLERISPYPEIGPQLLELEPENFDPETGERLQLRLHATASKNYDLYTRTPGDPPSLTLIKHSEHGLGHLRTPGQIHLDERDWIREGRLHLLQQALGLPSRVPAWWGEPALSLISLNRPRELARLQAILHDSGDRTLLRPFSRLVVAHPDPQYARTPDGQRRTPVAPYHAGFDPHRAPWRDLTSGQRLTPRFRRNPHLTESDLASLPGVDRVLCTTVGDALERNHRRPEAKALDKDGNPCTHTTKGLLKPAPTKAHRVFRIGKETRNLERAGITEDPTYTLYADPELEAWKQTILPALRRLAPGLIPPGRPSRHQRAQLTRQAGELAQAALRQHGFGAAIPNDAEQACYLYLRTLEQRSCACGCGTPLSGRARYTTPAHRTRAYRARTKPKSATT